MPRPSRTAFHPGSAPAGARCGVLVWLRSSRARCLLTVCGAMLAGSSGAAGRLRAEDAAPSPPLGQVGLAYEAARLLPAADRVPALEQVERDLGAVALGEADAAQKAAAAFLAGSIHFDLHRFDAAAADFGSAAKQARGGPFADDAAFAAIRALEAQGKDPEAAREWAKWEERFPGSPLAGEARLAQAWNAVRQGKLPDAEKRLSALLAAQPWLEKDARVVLLRATLAYLGNRPDAALGLLGNSTPDPNSTYLRALCNVAQGRLLQAAAAFQEVVDRWADSPLCDAARFAKANAFLASRAYRSAAEEFRRTGELATDPGLRAEAELRAAASVYLDGAADSALVLLRGVAERQAGSDVAARAQFLIGEVLRSRKQYAEAIVELNRVLTVYFQHQVAASAQYRVARCLDALGRQAEATSAYEAVVSGYPLEPEAPAAAYLAGVGRLGLGRPLQAAPHFQLVLDRYAARRDSTGMVVFASPAHQELVEASLCLLELSYHRAGSLGQLSGAPHLLLGRMPASTSPWRAWALLIDADAAAAQARYPEAQAELERLAREFPDHPAAISANQLLAWTYARQGRDSLAIVTEERMLSRYAASGSAAKLGSAYLDMAHARFNQKRYREAAAAYQDFLRRYPGSPQRLLALYQAGLCYLRLDRAGDAVDRWETIVRDSADAEIAERAWSRAGDAYFQAERYADAERCYRGLLEHFSGTGAAGVASLRLAQCAYNAGDEAAALEAYARVEERFPNTPYAREAAHGTEQALYRLGQKPQGRQILARLVEQYPTSAFAADAQFQIARQFYSEKRWTEAAEAFRRTVSQFPGAANADQAQYLMAECLAEAGQADAARQAYEQFLAFFPASALRPGVQFRLGMERFAAKDYAPAAVLFTQLVQDSVTSDVRSAALYNLALSQRMLGAAAEAEETLLRHRRELPQDARAAEVALQLGDLREAAGDAKAAGDEYERGLGAGPAPALAIELHFRAGRCREQLQDADGALRAYQAAVAGADKSDPFRLSALARCAALYEERHDPGRAAAAYRDIARHAPDAQLAAAARGRASQLEAAAAPHEDAAPPVPKHRAAARPQPSRAKP
jgi:TolA-binding protein